MSRVDLVLVEGFKSEKHAKLEVHRTVIGKPLLCKDDPSIVALASDARLTGVAIPFFSLDDVSAIAAFILDHCRLRAA
jgi:molybdopterin-guanine dinucleotide biosynthesis protein MobB